MRYIDPSRLSASILFAFCLFSFLNISSAQDVVIVIEDGGSVSSPSPVVIPDPPSTELQESSTSQPQIIRIQTPSLRLAGRPTYLQPEPGLQNREALLRSRPSLGGPFTMIGLGISGTIFGSLMATIMYDLEHNAFGGCYDSCDNSSVIGFSVLASAGVAITIVGVISLIRRINRRRAINRQLRAIAEW